MAKALNRPPVYLAGRQKWIEMNYKSETGWKALSYFPPSFHSGAFLKLFDTMEINIQLSAMKVLLTAHQEKFVGQKMKGGGCLFEDEVVREALRVYELVEQEDNDPRLEAALRHSLRSPLK